MAVGTEEAMFRMVLVLLWLLVAVTGAHAELVSKKLDFGGLQRTYLLYVPEGAAAGPGPKPLVLVLHGGGGSAREVRRSTRLGFERLADRHGFYVLYPDAIGRMWDTGSGEISERLTPRRDDLGFLRAAIEAVAAAHPVDASRVFATGISRGGQASYMLACEAPGLVRAIVPVAMTLPEVMKADCARGAPVGFLLVMGTADPVVPYAGGEVVLIGRGRGRVLSAEATVDLFRRRNGCGSGTDSAAVGAVDRMTPRGCEVPTQFDRINGGGHSWPSGRSGPILRGLLGKTNRDISAPEEIWAFFSRF
jgi:polyhydroxybutyrate depolymerase